MSALGAFPGEILAYKRQGLPLESSRGTGRGFAYAAAQNDECVRDSEWNALAVASIARPKVTSEQNYINNYLQNEKMLKK